jgi:hypothetical protein
MLILQSNTDIICSEDKFVAAASAQDPKRSESEIIDEM